LRFGPFTTTRNRRLRPDAYSEPGRPCFLTIRAYQNQSPFVDRKLNQAIVDVLLNERQHSQCSIQAYCLMPDHLHLLTTPSVTEASVLAFADRFKGLSTRESWRFGWRGKLWQPRSYDHVLRRNEDVEKVCEYILANPVRRGLVENPDEFPWSALVDPIL